MWVSQWKAWRSSCGQMAPEGLPAPWWWSCLMNFSSQNPPLQIGCLTDLSWSRRSLNSPKTNKNKVNLSDRTLLQGLELWCHPLHLFLSFYLQSFISIYFLLSHRHTHKNLTSISPCSVALRFWGFWLDDTLRCTLTRKEPRVSQLFSVFITYKWKNKTNVYGCFIHRAVTLALL